MPGPRNQQIVITQGELDDLNAKAASSPDTSANMQKQIDDLTTANAMLTSDNAALAAKLDAIRADIAPAVQAQ